MRKIKFKILDKDWTLRVLKKKKYKKKNGKDSVAITYGYKKCIDVGPKGVRYEIIAHELVHAYMEELCVNSTTNLSIDDLEEIFAELLSKHGHTLLALAGQLEWEIQYGSGHPVQDE